MVSGLQKSLPSKHGHDKENRDGDNDTAYGSNSVILY